MCLTNRTSSRPQPSIRRWPPTLCLKDRLVSPMPHDTQLASNPEHTEFPVYLIRVILPQSREAAICKILITTKESRLLVRRNLKMPLRLSRGMLTRLRTCQQSKGTPGARTGPIRMAQHLELRTATVSSPQEAPMALIPTRSKPET